MVNFIHLSATGVAEIAESTNLKGCPHTFLYDVHRKKMASSDIEMRYLSWIISLRSRPIIYVDTNMLTCPFIQKSSLHTLPLPSERLFLANLERFNRKFFGLFFDVVLLGRQG